MTLGFCLGPILMQARSDRSPEAPPVCRCLSPTKDYRDNNQYEHNEPPYYCARRNSSVAIGIRRD
jgi:hypothetical protein